jgi:hypothetical protein
MFHTRQFHVSATNDTIFATTRTAPPRVEALHHKGLQFSLLALPIGGDAALRFQANLEGYNMGSAILLYHTNVAEWYPWSEDFSLARITAR